MFGTLMAMINSTHLASQFMVKFLPPSPPSPGEAVPQGTARARHTHTHNIYIQIPVVDG